MKYTICNIFLFLIIKIYLIKNAFNSIGYILFFCFDIMPIINELVKKDKN